MAPHHQLLGSGGREPGPLLPFVQSGGWKNEVLVALVPVSPTFVFWGGTEKTGYNPLGRVRRDC